MGGPGGNTNETLYNLTGSYGSGLGGQLNSILQNGLYNPQVANSLIAAMQPQIERGLVSTESAFGAEGARFGSAAQIGVGDYESQAVLGENQVLANLYQTDQTEQLQLLESILPQAAKEHANQGSHLLSDIMGGLEIAGGAALTVATGGAAAPIGLAVGAMGANTIVNGNSNSPAAASSNTPSLQQALQAIAVGQSGGAGSSGSSGSGSIANVGGNSSTETFGTAPTTTSTLPDTLDTSSLETSNFQMSAGGDLGASDPDQGDMNSLLQSLGVFQ